MSDFAFSSPPATGVVAVGVVVVLVSIAGVGFFLSPPPEDRTTARTAAMTITTVPAIAHGRRLRGGFSPGSCGRGAYTGCGASTIVPGAGGGSGTACTPDGAASPVATLR